MGNDHQMQRVREVFIFDLQDIRRIKKQLKCPADTSGNIDFLVSIGTDSFTHLIFRKRLSIRTKSDS